MREILSSIFALFYLGNPECPYGIKRVEEFKNNKALYEEKIKIFTKKYDDPMWGFEMYPRDKDWDFDLSNESNYFG